MRDNFSNFKFYKFKITKIIGEWAGHFAHAHNYSLHNLYLENCSKGSLPARRILQCYGFDLLYCIKGDLLN